MKPRFTCQNWPNFYFHSRAYRLESLMNRGPVFSENSLFFHSEESQTISNPTLFQWLDKKEWKEGGNRFFGPHLVVFSKMCYKVPFFMGWDEKISCNTEINLMVRFRGAKKWARKTWTPKRDQIGAAESRASWLVSDTILGLLGVFRGSRHDTWTNVLTFRAISSTHVITYERPQKFVIPRSNCVARLNCPPGSACFSPFFPGIFYPNVFKRKQDPRLTFVCLSYTSAVASFSLIKRRRFFPF